MLQGGGQGNVGTGHDCEAFQGYLFARPEQVDAFEKLLAEKSKLNASWINAGAGHARDIFFKFVRK